MADTPAQPDDPVAVLRRWQQSGGIWEVLAGTGNQVTVRLCRCDGGEEVDRISSDDPALPAFLAGRSSSSES